MHLAKYQVILRVLVLSHFSHVQLFVTLWTVAHQAPLSRGFPGKNTGVGCHFLLQGIFLTQGLNPCLFITPALAGGFFITSTRKRVRNLLPYEQALLAVHPCPPVLSTSQPNRKSKWFMYGRHTLITFLRIFMNWNTGTNAFTYTHPKLHTLVQQENRTQTLLEHHKETRLGRFSGSQPWGTLCQYVPTL